MLAAQVYSECWKERYRSGTKYLQWSWYSLLIRCKKPYRKISLYNMLMVSSKTFGIVIRYCLLKTLLKNYWFPELHNLTRSFHDNIISNGCNLKIILKQGTWEIIFFPIAPIHPKLLTCAGIMNRTPSLLWCNLSRL